MNYNFRCVQSRLWAVLLVIGVFAMAVPVVMAQSLIAGDVSGVVTDPSGAVISDATVTLKSLDRGETQTTTTNTSGYYRFSLLKPGNYSVSVNQGGFKKEERAVAVNVGQVTAANFTLQVGQASEVLEVTGTAPLVNADNANVSTTFDQRLVQDVPNPGGDLTNIAQMAPGVTMNTSGGYGNLTANGLPATANLFTVNGENDMDPFFNINNSGATNLTLGVNEIQEATVITNPYSGQYGQQSGAQVTYITKSGTNAFHGSLKYDWNGRIMNANDWFANHTGAPRPFANANQWGADFGGPIFKDKTFFYLDFEGLRYVLPTAQTTYIPTQTYANAVLKNISAIAPTSLPLYQQLFNVWLAAPGSQTPIGLAATCPADATLGFTGSEACIQKFTATPTSPSNEWILAGRVDQNIGNNDKLFMRYRMDRGDQATYTDPVNPNFNATSKQPSYDGQLNWTKVISPTKTNQFLMTGSWYSAPFLQNEAKAVATFPFDMTFTGLSLTNFGRLRSFPQGRNVTQYQFIDDFSIAQGNHSMKFGANFRRYDVSDHNFFYRHPRLLIDDLDAFAYGSVSADGIGYVRQDFGPNHVVAPVAIYGLGFYGQDEWRVKSNLKLTLALRAEKNSNPVCQNHCFSRLTGSFNSIPTSVDGLIPYNQQIVTGLSNPYSSVDAIDLSPRFGFTWSPFGHDSTVISGGIGIFYDAMAQGIVEGSFQNMPGYTDFRVIDGMWADPGPNGALAQLQASAAALEAGFANGASYDSLHTSTGGVFRRPIFNNYAGQFHTPQYQEWNLQVQHAFGNNMSLMLNYFGNHGIHIPINNAGLNAADLGLGLGFPSDTASRVDKGFNYVNQYSTSAVASSNGLNVTFLRRFARGVSFQANYTWAHALDAVSNGGGFVYGNDSFEGQFYPASLKRNNYGNADYDIRHNLTATTLWEPAHKFSNRMVNGALGGWSFATTWFARTALPYSVLDENIAFPGYNTYAGVGFPLGQALGTGAAPGQQSCVNGDSQCFNVASFVDTGAASFSAYPFGYPTQRRNQYRGPNFFDMNFNVMKNFNITERVKFGFGANFYNLFNHPNFANPNWALADGDPTVGQIQSTVSVPASPYGSFVGAAASGRLVQLEGRIRF